MRVTLDASVFVSAYIASDVHHTESVSLLGRLIEVKIDLNAPVLVLAEVAATLARNTRDPKRGLAGKEMLEQTPRLQLYPLSLPLGKSAAGLARVPTFCEAPMPFMWPWPARRGAFL
jgi:predicted nucleic acid-binding protein